MLPHFSPTIIPPSLDSFAPTSVTEISTLITECTNSYCDHDPIPTSLLKLLSSSISSTICNIVNLSLPIGTFPSAVTSPFHTYSFNSLLHPYQSAYSKNHSTETTLLSLYDHLSNAIAHQQVSCLCLLDLSAAFDTLDHFILLIRLSTWFGISSITLSWFRSYLSSHSSSVSVGGTPCNVIISFVVSHSSVVGPILFNRYTTPLSTLMANTSLSHHLYADDSAFQFISITHNLLHSSTPTYLYRLLNIPPTRPTRSSNCLCLVHPKLTSRLKLSDRSFRNAAPFL